MAENTEMTNLLEHSITIPAFGKSLKLTLDMTTVREAETRLVEAKLVNPITYADLSHCFNESYRVLKNHLSNVGYQLLLAEKALDQAKGDVLLGSFLDFMKSKPNIKDNGDTRQAFLSKDDNYNIALDRINQLKAVISNFEGKIKVLENVNRYMNQKMYLISKSGLGSENLYVTSKGNK